MEEKNKVALLRHGIELFNRREFFECHEVLEQIWLQETPEEKPFYQGIIQIASAFHHYQCANLRGARSLLQRGSDKLRRYRPNHLGIDVDATLKSLEPWQVSLERGEPPQDSPLPAITISL